MQLLFNFVKPGLFSLPESDWWGFEPEDSIEIQPHWTMANIAVEMGLFPSVGQAKKNGWDKPIPEGFTEKNKLGKMKKSLFIHNPCDEFINDPEWGQDDFETGTSANPAQTASATLIQ
jgi:hypothetical protein